MAQIRQHWTQTGGCCSISQLQQAVSHSLLQPAHEQTTKSMYMSILSSSLDSSIFVSRNCIQSNGTFHSKKLRLLMFLRTQKEMKLFSCWSNITWCASNDEGDQEQSYNCCRWHLSCLCLSVLAVILMQSIIRHGRWTTKLVMWYLLWAKPCLSSHVVFMCRHKYMKCFYKRQRKRYTKRVDDK